MEDIMEDNTNQFSPDEDFIRRVWKDPRAFDVRKFMRENHPKLVKKLGVDDGYVEPKTEVVYVVTAKFALRLSDLGTDAYTEETIADALKNYIISNNILPNSGCTFDTECIQLDKVRVLAPPNYRQSDAWDYPVEMLEEDI